MQEQIQKRLDQLRAEYEAGQTVLVELEAKQDNLRKTLLRISGAIQVLEEISQTNQSSPEVQPESEQTVI